MSPLDSVVRRREAALQLPRTPDPLEEDLPSQPPPPPRARLRLRRNAPKLKTNTEQFLQSVSSADLPIPSIEEPHVYDDDEEVEDMTTDVLESTPGHNLAIPSWHSKTKSLSPPRTPAPEENLSNGLVNWYHADLDTLEYSESEASRPSTARSSGTFASVLSQLSHLSDYPGQYGNSTETSQTAPFSQDLDMTIRANAQQPTAKRARWTRAAEQHLWRTYLMYQQDATVTPYKVGSNNVPPTGVMDRVATMARQTWKQACAKSSCGTATVVEWPHSRGAARAHLRELCLSQARKAPRAPQFGEPRNPTPAFPTAIRFKNRRLGPTPSPCPFSGRDMVMSLAVSTSDSMQPQGPLAQLIRSVPEVDDNASPEPAYSLSSSLLAGPDGAELPSYEEAQQRPRLASPFPLNTYGPSVSMPHAKREDSTPPPQTVSAAASQDWGLASVAPGNKQSSKRRARLSLLEPPKAKRPSLTSDFWKDPSACAPELESSPPAPSGPADASSPPYLSPSTQHHHHQRAIEGPQLNLLEQLNSLADRAPTNMETDILPGFLPVEAPLAPARLGSPFSGKLSSFSFPGRISRPRDVPRTFATVNGVTGGRPKTPRTPVSRRALEEKLRDLCRRARRRSPSFT